MPEPDRIERDGSRSVYKGQHTREMATASYDVTGGDDGTVGAHGLGVYIPDNAVITNAIVDVVTTFTDGASDTATIALSAQSANDLVSAVAISNGANPWDAGIHAGVPDGAAANAVKTTAERELTATVATAALTAGKLNIFVEYFISD